MSPMNLPVIELPAVRTSVMNGRSSILVRESRFVFYICHAPDMLNIVSINYIIELHIHHLSFHQSECSAKNPFGQV